ncbi:NAD kinase [Croceiramulus getboli]|nr:NAD kinase [Flavobacteriaceae bacterium YJPT1-3]
MKVGIFGQFYHRNSGIYVQDMLDLLNDKGVEVIIEKNFLTLIQENEEIKKSYAHFSTFEELDSSYDLFFSIGGDGTILRTVTYVRDLGIPIVGINTGRLGFLATVQKDAIEQSINRILDGSYKISERSLVAIQTNPASSEIGHLNFALNEIAVTRKNTTAMISVSCSLNGEELTNYWADGLIISTPTGSTGYSLSCGGPVLTPDTASFILTPIAPHNLNARPLVVPDDTEITLEVSGREDAYMVSLDSRIATLPEHTRIKISKAPFTIKMVVLEEDTFLQTLRKKLLWGEDKRN